MFATDPLRLLVLALVVGMGTTVLAHASRSLRGEPYRRRFLAVGGVLVAASAGFSLADHPVLVVATWLAVSRAALALIGTGASAPDTGARARRAFLVGDIALVAAVALEAIDGAPALVALGYVVAALTRSAVAPFHRWLPDSIGAPTPASALLHAGIVGGGAVLLIGAGATVTEQALASGLLVAVAAASCLFAEAVMPTRPDVKGRLAWSTIAQMSFTLVLCGLGLHGAAALHLVAHGAFKGSLFLGSGATVRTIGRRRAAPTAAALGAGTQAAIWVGLGLVAAATVALVAGRPSADLAVPVLLAWVAAARAAIAWGGRVTDARQRVLGGAAAATALLAFVGATAMLKGLIAPGVQPGEPVLSAWWVAVLLVGLALVARLRPQLEPLVRPAGAPRPLAVRATDPARRRRPAALVRPAVPHATTGARS